MSTLSNVFILPKTVAVVGLSDKADRPSYLVANYLQRQGFKIIPVNPSLTEVLGEKAYPNLSAIPKNVSIDIVDVFRKPDAVMEIVEEILDLKLKPILWLQEGVVSAESKAKAEGAGLTVFMDVCIMKEHQTLIWQGTI